MKILVLSRWFNPSKNPRAFRTSELVRELSIRGYTVDLFAPCNAVFDDSFSVEHIKHYGVKSYDDRRMEGPESPFRKQNTLTKIVYSLLRNTVRYFSGEGIRDLVYSLHLLKALCMNTKNKEYDVVIAISYPFYVLFVTVVYTYLKKKGRIKIADCGDPFYYNPAFTKAFYIKYIERFVLRRFQWLIIPMEDAVPSYQHCAMGGRIRIIPQGFRLLFVRHDEYVPHEVPVFCYAGVFYKNIRDPRFFLEYLCSVNSDFCFVVYALNDLFTQEILMLYKQRLGERLLIKPPVGRECLIHEMAKMDFVINFDNDNATQRPSKLIDYAMSRRPILSFNCQTFRPEVFQAFLKGDYSAQYHVDLEQYDIRRVVDQFEELFEEKTGKEVQ